jgi:two-component system LytT family response regulator
MEHNFRHLLGPADQTLLLTDKKGYYYARLSQIIYCSSDNSYTEFFLTNGQRIVVSKPLRYFEQLTAAFGFFRIHHSHLINTYHLHSITRQDNIWHVQMSNSQSLPISRDRKTDLIEALEAQSLSETNAYYKKVLDPEARQPEREATLLVNRDFETTMKEDKILAAHAG